MTTLIVILLVLSFSLVSILRLGHYLFNHLGRLQTKPVSAGFKPGRNGIIFSIIFLPLLTILTVTLWQINLAKAAGTLTVEILAGYNLVVDSNVTSPSTFGPSAATVAGRVCNTGTDPITHVQVYIGNATANTPGLYPRRYTTDPDFAVHTALLDGGGSYAFTHEGGSLGLSDATRPAGTLAPGQCTVQYWTFSYPRCENVGGNPDEPQCQGDAVWGDSVKPNDDLWLNFDVWATGDGVTKQTATWTMHLRNEISAMANKIEPNGNPGGQWFNTDPMTIRPGGLITTNGILYRIGNVRFGFDNDGDYLPDYNFWVQPIGNPSGFDPGCFRLIRTTGVITVEGGSATSFNFTDQLYFTYPQVPDDNTNVIGEVFYTFIALGSNCSVTPSPYQEAASGYDNEKFNADYGTGGTVPMSVPQALVTIDKSGNPDLVSLGQIISYTMPFVNQSATESAGLTFYSGAYVNNPLVISDTIAAGTQYIAGSATYALSFTPNNGVKILYSTDYGQTWSEVEPVPAASVTTIQWWLQDPLPPTESGTASFAVQVPAVYSGGPVIENCANAQFGTGPSIGQACDSTLVLGNNSVGDRVWRDDNANGLQDAESSLPNITVWLYYDKNGDGALDNNDLLIMTDTTTSDATNYLFTDLPDAKYLVKVDHMDSDRPTGYSLTTDEIFAVDLDSGHADSNPVAYLDADFGFGPALRVTKSLLSPVAYEGQDITYRIRVENVRPGDGSGTAGTCTYSTWAQTEDAAHTGSSAAAWDYPERVFGTEEPDENYAFTDISNNTDLIAGTNFNLGGVKGNITKVEAIFSIYLSGPLANDEVEANIWYNDVLSGTKTYNATNGNLGEVNALSPGQANQGILAWDITTLGNWQASDFNGSILDLAFATNKGGGAGDANFYLDAIGFRVTTDETCGSPSDTLNPVPLTDVFDASLLEFVSADPPHTSIGSGSTPYGNTGIINWNNIGPLHAGGTEEIIVTFRGLDPGVTPKPLTNTAQVQNAYFATGEPANDDEDDAVTTITATGSISGVVWSDPNINGWQSPVGYESGTDFFIPNVTVVLHQCIGSGLAPSKPCSGSGNSGTWTAIYTETTDSNGHYLFDGLLDGYYRVVVDETTILDGSPTQTGDPDITPGLCGPSGDNQWGAATNNLNTLRVINNANHIINGNFGYYVYSAIYGTIWQDYNADGIFDGNEPGLDNGAGGITVRLYNSGGSVIATTQTDADGYYEFNTDSGGNPLSAGTYTIEVDAFGTFPSGTWSQTGDPDASLDNQHTVTITNGQVSGSHDFGYIGDSDIGDTIFTDWDGDGTKDTGDAGISNITVYLYHDANGDGILNSGDTPIMTDTTDANGNYLFENLPVGDYVVQVDETALTGMSQTADRDTTLDGRTAITTDGTNDILDADFGYQPFGTASIGDYVWKDQNGDGVQDLFESGISNILVSLYHDNGNGFLDSGDALITTTTTGPDGDYLFENLAAGDYLVRVDQSDSDLPTNYGSRYYLSTGNNPEVVTLSTGEACLDADFGFAPPGAIGDYIWQDNNADGNQDSNEPPLENVTVELYQGSTLIDTTQTDFTGHYLFTGLMSNTYRVVVTPPANYDLTYDPDAYADPTTAFPACDSDPTATYYNCDNEAEAQIYHGRMTRLDRDFGYKPPRAIGDFVWLDSDGDGVQDSGETGLGGVVITLTLPSGTKYTTATDIEGYYSFGSDVLTEDGDYTLTIDTTSLPKSGMVATYDDDSGTTSPDNQTVINISTTAFFTDVLDFGYRYAGPYSITGTVFFDQGHTADGTNDLFTTGDTPYANITVYLYESGSSIPKASTTTDASGHYTFTYLYDGDYTVSVKTTDPQIDGLTLTASPNGNSYNAVTISGASVSNQDFGFFEDRPILSITKTNDPTGNVAPGDTITYTIIVNNSGSLTATGVVITDRMPISVTFVSASTPYSTPTGGVITWTVGALPVSATHTVTMAVQLNTGVPAGTIITNTAWVTSNEGITDTDTVTNEVIGSTTDLTIVKSDQPDPVIAGQVLTYTLVYTNNGPADAQAVYITDTLPTSVTFGSVVSENPPLSGPTQTGQLLTWYTPTLATGASGSLIFTVTVGSGVSGTITNSVAITTTTPESNPNNNNDDEPTDVEGLATISGHLYLDTNGNGSQDIGEPDLVNVDVIITNTLGITQIVTSDSNGDWTATVPPGSTQADVDETDPQYPSGYTQTEGTDPTTVTAVAGVDTDAGNDGYYLPATISGHLYLDTNGNGSQDIGEPDLVNVDVIITNTLGITQIVTSDSNGDWTATVPPGSTQADVDETDPQYPSGYTQTEGTDPTTVTAVAGVDTDAGNDGYYLPADLTITKSGQPGIVMAGDVLTYTLVYTNLSSADAQDVYITDTLPVSVTFGSVVSENPSISGPTVAGRFLTWFTPTLAASVSGQIVFTVTTNADANPFVYNTVVITTTTPDSNPDNNDDDEITFVSVPGQSDLAISKSVNPNVVVAGQVITYTLIYGNNGIAEAQAVYITDTLPAGVTFGGVVSENPALSGPTQTGQSLTWHTPTLTIGASGSIVFTATVNSGVSGTITNMVSITTTTPDSDPTNNQDDAPTTVPTPGLLLTPDNSGVGQPGQTLTYTHILTNTGDITDTYLITWTYTNGFTTTVNTTSVTLPPGGSTVLTVPVTIPPTATSGDTSTATITATSTVNPGLHDTVYDTTTVETPGMVVEKLVSLARVAPHQEVTYTIRITNTGDITLTTVRVVDTLPPGFTYVAGSGVPTPDSITGGQLVWNDASAGAGLTPGQTTDVIFRATMPTTTDTYINTAAVTGTHPTGVITDSDTAPVVVTDPAVEVAKNTVPPGATDGLITFTIRITNIGPSTLNQVPLVDHFTGPVVYVGGSPAADTVDNVNQVVDWDDLTVNFGRDLAPNQSFVLTTVFSLTTHSTTFTMTNVATVTNALDVYSNTANDDSDAALVVNQPTAIQLLYFNAVRSGAWVNLNWATAVELDNYGFRLLRSATGSLADATEIAFVPGQGYGTASGATYTFTDKTAAADQAYTYWLVDVDVNGVETRHNPVTVDVVDIDQGGNHTIFLPLIFKH